MVRLHSSSSPSSTSLSHITPPLLIMLNECLYHLFVFLSTLTNFTNNDECSSSFESLILIFSSLTHTKSLLVLCCCFFPPDLLSSHAINSCLTLCMYLSLCSYLASRVYCQQQKQKGNYNAVPFPYLHLNLRNKKIKIIKKNMSRPRSFTVLLEKWVHVPYTSWVSSLIARYLSTSGYI